MTVKPFGLFSGQKKYLIYKIIWMLYRANFDTNKGSIRICEKNGWRIVGKRENIGKNKFGLWQSTVVMKHRGKTVGVD